MSLRATTAAWELRALPPVTKLVLVALADRHNKDSGECFPSQDLLAVDCGISERSVRDHLKWLETNNLISRETVRYGRGKGSRTDFELLFLDRQNIPVQFIDRNESVNRPEGEGDLDRNDSAGEEQEGEQEGTGNSARVVFDYWNKLAERISSWTVHSKLTPSLQKTINARIKERSAGEVKSFILALSDEEWATSGKYSTSTLAYVCRPSTFDKHFDKLVSSAPRKTVQDNFEVGDVIEFEGYQRQSYHDAGGRFVFNSAGEKTYVDRGTSAGSPELDFGQEQRQPSQDVSVVQPFAQEETRPMPVGDQGGGKSHDVLPPLRGGADA